MNVWKKRDEEINSVSQYFAKKHGKYFFHEKTYSLPKTEEAASLIMANKDKTFYVIGDYDVDGICATSIMVQSLRMVGCKASYRIPKRFSEGYGISKKILEEIPEGAVVITVDNGIAAIDEIALLKERGHIVIVTDHHLPGGQLPKADIIVNPKVYFDDFDDYCGTGVALKIAEKLLKEVPKSFVALAGIATIADSVPLTGENHSIVKEGLRILNERVSLCVGLHAILSILNKDKISETDIAFGIAPMLNASGRLYDDGGSQVVGLFLERDMQRAIETSLILKEINDERKRELENALLSIREEEKEGNPVVLYMPEVSEGILGLVAAGISEEGKTAFVFTDSEKEGVLKGSARTAQRGVHLKNLLDQNAGLLEKYGGHEGAAGLSMKLDNLEKFKEKLARDLEEIGVEQIVYYDLDLEKLDAKKAYEEMAKYAPYGVGNEAPVFKVSNVDFATAFCMGAVKEHKKVNKKTFDILWFHANPDVKTCDILGQLSENEFRGQKTIQVIVKKFK